MGSPAKTFDKEPCNDEMKSTNQFAPFANTFHKVANGGMNFKNYSEIQIGHNQNLEETYKKKFWDRKRACELKFGSYHKGSKLEQAHYNQTQVSIERP